MINLYSYSEFNLTFSAYLLSSKQQKSQFYLITRTDYSLDILWTQECYLYLWKAQGRLQEKAWTCLKAELLYNVKYFCPTDTAPFQDCHVIVLFFK